MTPRWWAGLLAVAALIVVLVWRRPAPAPLPARIVVLMECIECAGGELEAVVAMGDTAVAVLDGLLRDGPPTESLARMERSLRSNLGDPNGALLAADSTVVAKQLADYTRLYRIRAALGLGAIGGSSARRALCGARSAGATGAVAAAIDSALSRTGGITCP